MNEILRKYNQEHLIKYYERCSDKDRFLKDIDRIDFEYMNSLYKAKNNEFVDEKISIVKPVIKSEIKDNALDIMGTKIVDEGKLALITMAGGQGTRLGHDGPKGTYMLDLDKRTSLFEIIASKISKYNIPWLIMTSNDNHEKTVEFFRDNNNFGIKTVKFFIQRELPLLHEDGKILVGPDGYISFGADGSGGIFNALLDNDLITYLEKFNISHIFINGIDNILTNPVDFKMLGLAIEKKLGLLCKSVAKKSYDEKVGVFCYKNNKPSVIEYINIPEELSMAKDENDNYLYNDANINSYLLSIILLKEIINKKLPMYTAHKKISYLNEENNIVVPISPNAYKFECFIFDAFKYANDFLVLRVNRTDEFAPIKNSDEAGVDCPSSAIKLYKDYIKNNFTK